MTPTPTDTPPASAPARVADVLPPRPPVATAIVLLAVVKLALHLLTNVFTPYGIHRDELLYLAMGRHLQLWRMEFPPLIAILAERSGRRSATGSLSIRLAAALAGTLVLVLAALVARELGGGLFAAGGRGARGAVRRPLPAHRQPLPARRLRPALVDAGALRAAAPPPHNRRWWIAIGLARRAIAARDCRLCQCVRNSTAIASQPRTRGRGEAASQAVFTAVRCASTAIQVCPISTWRFGWSMLQNVVIPTPCPVSSRRTAHGFIDPPSCQASRCAMLGRDAVGDGTEVYHACSSPAVAAARSSA